MKNFIIREATATDKAAILNLLNNVFDEVQRSDFKRGDDFWIWKYESNIFGKPILTVAELEGKIIGFNNLWPWQFRYRGQLLKAYQPCDSVIHKDFQKFGLFTKMRFDGLERAKSQHYDVIFNFPNSNSIKSYLNLGWTSLGQPEWYVCFFKPINILRNKFKSAKSIPFLLDEKYSLDCPKLQELADENKNYDKIFTTSHQPGFFQWRYQNHPKLKYGMVTFENKHKSIAAIFTIKQNGGIREMVVVDVIGHRDSFFVLIKELKKAGKSMNVNFIAIMKNNNFGKLNFLSHGFVKVKNKNLVTLPLNLSIETQLLEINNWGLCASMHDSI